MRRSLLRGPVCAGAWAGLLALGLTLAACRAGQDKDAAPGSAPLLLAADDVLTAAPAPEQGVLVTGTVVPVRQADLRAEIQALVQAVPLDNGEAVRQGDVLVRLDATAVREALGSAEAALRTATVGVQQARRQLQRMQELRAQGMVTQQAFDDTQLRLNTATSELSAAQANAAAARQQLGHTIVRAPFAGVVSERKVSVGDTVQPGRELIKVIDPTTLRFDGVLPSDDLQDVEPGRAVNLRITGYPDQVFTGVLRRVDATASAATRQVAITVDFTGAAAPRIAGLYGEGRILPARGQAAMAAAVPESCLVRAGGDVYVWRIRAARLARTPVQLGARDPRTGLVTVRAGLQPGETVLRVPLGQFADGQGVTLQPPAATR